MRLQIVQCFVGLIFAAAVFTVQHATAQTRRINAVTDKSAERLATQKSATPPAIAASAAYAEVFASKAETEADLKVLLIDFAEEAAPVRAKMLERDFLQRALRWLEVMPAESSSKMTQALGRLLVRKAQSEANLKSLQNNYADDHPLVKKARTRLAVYNSEMEKLLQ